MYARVIDFTGFYRRWAFKQIADESIAHSFTVKANVYDSDKCDVKSDMLLVECGSTAHIVTDKSKFTSFDHSFTPEQHYIELANGTKAYN